MDDKGEMMGRKIEGPTVNDLLCDEKCCYFRVGEDSKFCQMSQCDLVTCLTNTFRSDVCITTFWWV